MNFEVKELDEKEVCFELNLNDNCFKSFKTQFKNGQKIAIDFDALNLGVSLYGKDKKESKIIQKSNYKQMMKVYHLLKKVVRFLKHKKLDFDGTLYVKNLSEKKNNNDFMLSSLLELKFNVSLFKKYDYVIRFACDYIDKENSLNKMCGDFKDNKCRKQQEKNLDKCNGCCVNPCKYKKEGEPCPVKCLSCKLFMCSYLENLGYCFYINYIPILRIYLCFFERFVLLGCLFRSEKQTKHYLMFIRFIYYVYILMIVLLVVMLGVWLIKFLF